jgi:glycerate kinase
LSTRPVLVAPDKFKGTFAAAEVAAAVGAGLRDAGHAVVELPVADGGDGTARVLLQARGGEWRAARVRDALGRPVEAGFALLGDGRTAVLDMAEASGLWRLAPDELDPWRASTAGTGELILAATAAGAREVIVAAGGSATVDGGAGALEVLAGLADVPELIVACDVTSTWEEAPPVFGPQKGASPDDVVRLGARLDALAERAPRDPRGVPRTGAAGGLSGGLWAWHGAELVSGAGLVLDAIGFDAQARAAVFVVTGEGRIDDQTAQGKAVGEVARRAAASGRPCDAVVGRNDLDRATQERLGLRTILEAGDREAMLAAGRRLGEEHPPEG